MTGAAGINQKNSTFTMDINPLGAHLKIIFSGSITEKAQLTAVDLKDKEALVLDFDGISYINSAGVRRWIFWMWNIEKEFPDLKILIERCPTVMLKQIISIANFVPKMAQVKSFFIPYFCETCDESSSEMFNSKPLLDLSDKEFSLAISGKMCQKCGGTLISGALPEQLNKFINQYKPE